jgi:drug/metabolite transporter (DMT)-like permease
VVLALVVAVIAISFAAIFFKKAEPTHPLVAAGVRLAIAATILAPFALRAARAGRLPRGVLVSAVLGGVAYALHFGTWVTSLGLTSVAASVTLVTATPLLLAVFAIVTRRDQPAPRHWVAIGLALSGLALVGSADASSEGALAGDALAFAGAASMAGYMLLVRRCGDGVDVWAFSGVATFVGAVLLLGSAVVTGVPIAFPSTEAAVFIALAALVPQLVGHTLLTWSLRHTTPTVVGIATVGEPVGSTILGILWLHELAGPLTLAGCGVTLAGVITALSGRAANPDRNMTIPRR